jgi:hypothetical protein
MTSGAACDPGDLLTVEQYRQRMPTTRLVDDVVCGYLRSADALLRQRWGAPFVADLTVTRLGGYGRTVLSLPRPAESIGSIVERAIAGSSTFVTLAANDYELSVDGIYLTRLSSGTHQREYWDRYVVVTYDTTDDTDIYIDAQIALVKLAIANEGRTSHSSPQEGVLLPDYVTARESILSTSGRARPLF